MAHVFRDVDGEAQHTAVIAGYDQARGMGEAAGRFQPFLIESLLLHPAAIDHAANGLDLADGQLFEYLVVKVEVLVVLEVAANVLVLRTCWASGCGTR